MKTYSAASQDLASCIERMQQQHHADLEDVAIGALFLFDDESPDHVLTHQGYPCAAVVRITPLRQRALGVPDAVIVVDRAGWQSMKPAERDALIDHELQHLARVEDSKAGGPAFDALNRPKLAMRRHDHQLGWFDVIAQRHGQASPEMRQAKQLLKVSQQLYFDFGTARSSDAAAAGVSTAEPSAEGSVASNGGAGERRTLTSSNGESVELRTGEEISDEMRARNPNGETMGEAANPQPEDPAAFEAAAKAQVEAFNRGRKGPRRIDGRKGAH